MGDGTEAGTGPAKPFVRTHVATMSTVPFARSRAKSVDAHDDTDDRLHRAPPHALHGLPVAHRRLLARAVLLRLQTGVDPQ